MAILNFPDTTGQPIDGSFTHEANGVLYSWDGYKWTANTEGGGGDANHNDGPTPPTTGDLGDQWFNTDDGRLYTYTEDSSGTLVWIDASPDSIAGGGDGSGGGGTTVNYNGASAWASVAADGTISGSQNIASVVKDSTGKYIVTFTTPMSNADYAVVVSGYGSANYTAKTTSRTTNNFNVIIDGGDSEFSFAVHSANAIAPQSGVGADAWGSVAADGTLESSFNVASVSAVPTGLYDVVFTTPMPTDDYAVSVSAVNPNPSGGAVSISYEQVTVNGFRVRIKAGSSFAGTEAPFSFTVHASSTVTPTYTWTRNGTTLEPANAGDGMSVSGDVLFGKYNRMITNGRSQDQAPLLLQNTDNDGYNFVLKDANSVTTAFITTDGSPTFKGRTTFGNYNSGDADSGGIIVKPQGQLVIQGLVGSKESPVSAIQGYQTDNSYKMSATWYILSDGNASFVSTRSSNVFLNLEPDNSANYTTTMVDGEEQQVYSGPTLDVKALLLTLQTAAARIATLEAKVATLESDHTTLMNNNNGGGY